MKMNLLKRLLLPTVLLGLFVFLLSSCKPAELVSQRDNVFLAPDLYLHAQWEAEQRLNEAFLAQLDTDARNPTIAGQALASRLAQFRKDRSAIHAVNEKWIAEIKTHFDARSLAITKLPPKPPPPPPPIIEDPTKLVSVFAAQIRSNVPLVILFAPGTSPNTQVKLYQGKSVVTGKAGSGRKDGIMQFNIDITTLKSGPAVLQLPGTDGKTPVNVGVLIMK